MFTSFSPFCAQMKPPIPPPYDPIDPSGSVALVEGAPPRGAWKWGTPMVALPHHTEEVITLVASKGGAPWGE